MPKYKKKPVVIDAFQLGVDSMPDWFVGRVSNKSIILYSDKEITNQTDYNLATFCDIHTLEGIMRGDYKDYIIKGVQGEIYPCKPDIFNETYEAVED